MPPEYRAAEWDQAPAEAHVALMDWRTPELLKVKLARGRGWLFAGPTGTGKSCLAALLCKEVAGLGRSVRWEYLPNMLDALSDPKRRSETVARQRNCSLLVWDDFGVERLADWQIGHLDRIVELRSSYRRSMIVTTNVDLAMLAADPALQRMTDRWRAMCTGMVIPGKSRRTAQ